MAILSAKQKDALIKEINKLSSFNKFAINNPKGVALVAIDGWNEDILWISRVLIGEIHVDEFIGKLTNSYKRKYYTDLMESNAVESKHKKIGFSPNHGKYNNHKRKLS